VRKTFPNISRGFRWPHYRWQEVVSSLYRVTAAVLAANSESRSGHTVTCRQACFQFRPLHHCLSVSRMSNLSFNTYFNLHIAFPVIEHPSPEPPVTPGCTPLRSSFQVPLRCLTSFSQDLNCIVTQLATIPRRPTRCTSWSLKRPRNSNTVLSIECLHFTTIPARSRRLYLRVLAYIDFRHILSTQR
jgi:hypothetical protein